MADKSEVDSIWETFNTYSVVQAACLMAGVNPSCVGYDSLTAKLQNSTAAQNSNEFVKVYGCFSRLASAIDGMELEAVIKYPFRASKGLEPDESEYMVPTGGWYYKDRGPGLLLPRYPNEPGEAGSHHIICSKIRDWGQSTVQREHIKAWLEKIDFHDRFFYPTKVEDTPDWDVLNPDCPTHPLQLAAALKGWREASDPKSRYFWGRHRTPKKAIIKFIEDNAKSLGLLDDHGNPPTENALKAIGSVAGWDHRRGRRKERPPDRDDG